MTLKELKVILNGITGFDKKVAYRAFPAGEAPALPFICYTATSTDNFFADNKTYEVIQGIDIELYSKTKDETSEGLIEAALDTNNIGWNKDEEYIDSENVFEVIYSIEI